MPEPRASMAVTHRRATFGDAPKLFDVRRRSIHVLAPAGMSDVLVEDWASALTIAGMEDKIRQLEVWIAEFNDGIAGWGAIRGDHLANLYTDPDFSGRGIGSGLLTKLEGLMRARGIQVITAYASSNAEAFYLRRGYKRAGPATDEKGQPITKRLS